jgi:hypothetical protein
MAAGSYLVRLTMNGTPVTDASVDLTQDREWNEVVAAIDPLQYRGVISFQGADTGVSDTHTLYVPKGPSTTFRVCPEAVTLGQVSSTCTNGVRFMGPSFPETQGGVTVGTIVISGTTYWYASGLTGSGGEGEDDEGNTIPFFPVWSIPVIGVIGWYVLKREGWVGA